MPNVHEQYRGYTIDQLLQSLEGNAEPGSRYGVYLENLILVRTAEMVNKQLTETARVTGVSANQIKEALAEVSTKLETASGQSSQLGKNLNKLTAALVVAAVLTAGATVFQAYETKRQANYLERQLQMQIQPTSPTSPQRPATTGRQSPPSLPQPEQ